MSKFFYNQVGQSVFSALSICMVVFTLRVGDPSSESENKLPRSQFRLKAVLFYTQYRLPSFPHHNTAASSHLAKSHDRSRSELARVTAQPLLALQHRHLCGYVSNVRLAFRWEVAERCIHRAHNLGSGWLGVDFRSSDAEYLAHTSYIQLGPGRAELRGTEVRGRSHR